MHFSKLAVNSPVPQPALWLASPIDVSTRPKEYLQSIHPGLGWMSHRTQESQEYLNYYKLSDGSVRWSHQALCKGSYLLSLPRLDIIHFWISVNLPGIKCLAFNLHFSWSVILSITSLIHNLSFPFCELSNHILGQLFSVSFFFWIGFDIDCRYWFPESPGLLDIRLFWYLPMWYFPVNSESLHLITTFINVLLYNLCFIGIFINKYFLPLCH